MGIRPLFAALTVCAVFPMCATAQPWTPRPPDEIDATLAESISGKWALATDPDGCGTSAHRISFSADRRAMNVEHDKPFEYNGRQINLSRYRVLYAEGKSVTMYLDGEDRRTALGDRVIWILTLDGRESYYWRRTDWHAEGKTAARKRCGD